MIRLRPFMLAPVALAALLGACRAPEAPVDAVRPAMVVRPQPAAARFEAFAGEVRARVESPLAFRVPGRVLARQVDVGERVAAGALLATLDPADVQLQAQAAQAALAAAEANLELARAEHERHAELLARGLVSRQLADNKRTTLQAAEAQVRQARAQRDVSRNQAGYAELRAPAAGVVAQRLVEAGQVVAAGQAVFVLAVDGEREVAIGLPEAEVGQFEQGQAVRVALWSAQDRLLSGHLREIAPAADAGARTFAARVALDPTDAPVELGQSARVFIATAGDAGLRVPLAAVSARDGQSFVWVVDPATGALARRAVTVRAWSEDGVTLDAGVTPDEWVVAAGVHLLREGQRVRPVDRDNRSVAAPSAAQG